MLTVRHPGKSSNPRVPWYRHYGLKTMPKRNSAALLFLFVCLTWGTTWMAMKLAVATIPPMEATGLRFLMAAPFLILLAKLYRAPLLFPRGQRWLMPIISLFYFAIPFFLMIFGEKYIPSSIAAIIFANMPIAVLVASAIMLKERVYGRQIAGVLMSVLSLVGIILVEMGIPKNGNSLGIAAMILAVVIHAALYVISRKHCGHISVLTYNAVPCLGAAVFLLLASPLFEHSNYQSFSLLSISAVAYLGMVAGVLGIMFYFALQKAVSPFQASLVFLIFPVIAIAIEDLLSGHMVNTMAIMLMVPLLLGVLLIKLPVRAKPEALVENGKPAASSV